MLEVMKRKFRGTKVIGFQEFGLSRSEYGEFILSPLLLRGRSCHRIKGTDYLGKGHSR